jgi:hypothetical protein
MIVKIDKSVRQVETNDIRAYISDYENESNAGKVTLDNIRRIISSFFAWLEDENYIVKSPARRIHKIRVSIQTNSLHGGMAFSIADGALPDGLMLKSNGQIYGIPTKTGEFEFTVKAVYNKNEKAACRPLFCGCA